MSLAVLRAATITGVRSPPFELLFVIPSVVLLYLALLTGPLYAVVVIVALLVILVAFTHPVSGGTALWLTGPLMGSGLPAGVANVDQLMSLTGAALLVWAVIRGELTPGVTGALFLPLAAGLAVLITAAYNDGAGLAGAARFLVLAVGTFALGSLTLEQAARLIRVLTAVVLVTALSVLQQLVTRWPTPYASAEGEGLRYGGLLGHPNFAAYALGLASVALFQRARSTGDYLLIFTLLVACISTGSRTALVVTAACLITSAVLGKQRQLLALCLFTVLLVPFSGPLVSRLHSVTATGGLTGANASGWRLLQWQRSWDLGADSRILGIGWQRASDLLPQNLGVHNLYLGVAVELGAVGAILVATGICLTVLHVRKSWRLGVCLAFLLVSSFPDPVLLYPSSLVLFLCLAMIVTRLPTDTAHHPVEGIVTDRSRDHVPVR